MADILAQKLKRLPLSPGVYIFKNAEGKILYIGKATRLKERVSSYFQGGHRLMPDKQLLVKRIADIDVMVLPTPTEALLLERTLIQRHKPPYNVDLKDDKHFQFIKITAQDPFPRILRVRDVSDDRAHYFGPFTNGRDVSALLYSLARAFPICDLQYDFTRRGRGRRPCFKYHMKRCAGACVGALSSEKYRALIKSCEEFLAGRRDDMIRRVEREMRSEARKKKFERAAMLRDRLAILQRAESSHIALLTKKIDTDVFAATQEGRHACVALLMVRQGKLIGKEHFLLSAPIDTPEGELLERVVESYYRGATFFPRTIMIASPLPETALVQEWLMSQAQKSAVRASMRPRLLVPRRGTYTKLIRLARENAAQHVTATLVNTRAASAAHELALLDLRVRLTLDRTPRRIEGYDISNLQGKEAAGSMVVFENGVPKKSDYRMFRIRRGETPNDPAMMGEVLTRRLVHTGKGWRYPDLFLLDGGKGQLSGVLPAFRKRGVTVPLISLAKRKEEIYFPGRARPLLLPRDSRASLLLQHIRNESHRFAKRYHTKLRSKKVRPA